MIGLTVDSKVKRYARANRKAKTLIKKSFLQTLEEEVRRVVVAAAEETKKTGILVLAVAVPTKKISERLVCDSSIRGCIRDIAPDIPITKVFLAGVNAYVGAMIITSLKMVEGAYLSQLASGDATAKIVDREPEKPPPTGDGAAVTVKKGDIKVEPTLPRDHIAVTFTVQVQKATLNCKMRFFTAKTTKQLEQAIIAATKRHLDALGIEDPATVEITEAKKAKRTKGSK